MSLAQVTPVDPRSSYITRAGEMIEPTRDVPSEAALAMWQIYAMMAKDQIDEQLHEAERRRVGHDLPKTPHQRRRFHLPSVHLHTVHPSSRTA